MHVVADAAVSLLALIGLVVGSLLGWLWLDRVMGLLGTLVIANWSWNLMRASGAVLLDMQPNNGLAAEIARRLEAGSDDRICDLHLWRLGPAITPRWCRWCPTARSRRSPIRQGSPVFPASVI